MSLRNKLRITFISIVVLAILAGIVDYPKGPDIRFGSYFKELKVHLGLDLMGGTELTYQADTSEIEESEKSAALEGVRDVIERRVNTFGVSEPVVQTSKSGDNWRVIVELPGITDVNQAVERIGETPLLEFKEEAPPRELTDEEKKQIEDYNVEARKKAEGLLKEASLEGADFAAMAARSSEDPGSKEQGGDLDYFEEGIMVPAFEEVVFNQAEVGKVYPEIVETEYGFHIILKTDERTSEEGKKQVRASHILILKKSDADYQVGDINFENTGLTGKQLNRAFVEFDQNTGLPMIGLEFDDEGKGLFAEITERNVGKIVAIYLDGSPISTPRVNEKIPDGKAVIEGDFNLAEAKLLVQRLNSGALPVPISLISQQNIGATLGKASVEKSLFAGLLGISFVALFMIIFYRLPGLLSVFSLFIYALLVMAIFKLWPVTLTLAGVAGFILSIGMAVDANVLIYARMKEELRQGKPLNIAIEEGFSRAWPSIRDSNISSIITCFILSWFGTSLIKGFAITLGIGIVVSMFSAMIVSKTFLRLLPERYFAAHLKWFGIRSQNIKK